MEIRRDSYREEREMIEKIGVVIDRYQIVDHLENRKFVDI